MIRKFEQKDLPQVMNLWLETNIQTHDFIPEKYWTEHFQSVKASLPNAELYVCDTKGTVDAFIGIVHGYIAGIFVSSFMQSKGIGKQLLDKCKTYNPALSLHVYEKNSSAVRFYLREGFFVDGRTVDESTGEVEYCMTWQKQNND